MRKTILLIVLFVFSYVNAQEVRATVSSNNIQMSDVFTFKVEAINAHNNPEVEIGRAHV